MTIASSKNTTEHSSVSPASSQDVSEQKEKETIPAGDKKLNEKATADVAVESPPLPNHENDTDVSLPNTDIPANKDSPLNTDVPSYAGINVSANASSKRPRLPINVQQTLLRDIQAVGGIDVVGPRSGKKTLSILCDKRPELYGRRGDRHRKRILQRVWYWQQQKKRSIDEWVTFLARFHIAEIPADRQKEPLSKKAMLAMPPSSHAPSAFPTAYSAFQNAFPPGVAPPPAFLAGIAHSAFPASVAHPNVAAASVVATSVVAPSVGATSVATKGVAAKSIATKSVAAKSVAAPSVAAQSVNAQRVAAASVAAPNVAAPSVAAQSLDAQRVAAQSLTAPSVAAQSVNAQSHTAQSVAAASPAVSPQSASLEERKNKMLDQREQLLKLLKLRKELDDGDNCNDPFRQKIRNKIDQLDESLMELIMES